MSDCIYRGTVLKLLEIAVNESDNLKDLFSQDYIRGCRNTLSIAIKDIQNIPAADVRPERHGEWVWNPNGMDWNLGAWQCSKCGGNGNFSCNPHINPHIFVGSNYCSNCGAKMDGKDGDTGEE